MRRSKYDDSNKKSGRHTRLTTHDANDIPAWKYDETICSVADIVGDVKTPPAGKQRKKRHRQLTSDDPLAQSQSFKDRPVARHGLHEKPATKPSKSSYNSKDCAVSMNAWLKKTDELDDGSSSSRKRPKTSEPVFTIPKKNQFSAISQNSATAMYARDNRHNSPLVKKKGYARLMTQRLRQVDIEVDDTDVVDLSNEDGDKKSGIAPIEIASPGTKVEELDMHPMPYVDDDSAYLTQEDSAPSSVYVEINTDDAVRGSRADDDCELVEVASSRKVNTKQSKFNVTEQLQKQYNQKSPQPTNITIRSLFESVGKPTSYNESSPDRLDTGICQNLEDENDVIIAKVLDTVMSEKVKPRASLAEKALGTFLKRKDVPDLRGNSLNGSTRKDKLKSSSSLLGLRKANGVKNGAKTKKPKGKSLTSTSTHATKEAKRSFFGAREKRPTPEEEDPLDDPDWDESIERIEVKKKRRKRSNSHGADNPIEIEDSDEDAAPARLSLDETRRLESPINLARVAVGSHYSHTECKLELKRDRMRLRYKLKKKGGTTKAIHTIGFDDVEMFRYYVSKGQEVVLAIMRVKPTEPNGLMLSKYLRAVGLNEEESRIRKMGYIVLELRSISDIERLLQWMREKKALAPFVDDNETITEQECRGYAETMLENIELERKDREDSVSSSRKRRRNRSGKKKKSETNEVMLVFPFGADEEKIDSAADLLTEAKRVVEQASASGNTAKNADGAAEETGVKLKALNGKASKSIESPRNINEASDTLLTGETDQVDSGATARDISAGSLAGIGLVDSEIDQQTTTATTNPDDTVVVERATGNEQASGADSNEETGQKRTRAHYLTIRREDFDRLEQGEFLNDTLIDFWMQWLTRKEDRETSPLHIFSSHFYTTLSEDGTDAVESWTARKNIDIFSKRFIFIPINKNLHWSLCVVVNPAHILERSKLSCESFSEEEEKTPFSCILFLDSLKAHRKDVVARNVRNWLNAEWKRLRKPQSKSRPFNRDTMEVLAPNIPYQDNSWDCGVFVCRYAFALFMLRHKEITIGDYDNRSPPLRRVVTDQDEFQFDMRDIERMRDEMKALISNLATSYTAWNEEVAAKKKREAAEAVLANKLAEAEKEAEGVKAKQQAVKTAWKEEEKEEGEDKQTATPVAVKQDFCNPTTFI